MPRAMSVSDLQAALATPNPPIVLDVRREANLLESPAMISGAKRIQPEAIAEGASELPAGARVVAYCVHGRAVSQGAASTLEGLGFDASYLEGGIEGWKSSGGATSA